MKQKPILDLGTLATLVVNTAITDTSSPDPENLRVGWRTDYLLTNCIDGLVVGQYNDPAAYAEIGRQVLFHVRDAGDLNLPEVAALAQLAIFRGERLLPVSQEREKMLSQMARGLEETVSALPDGTRKIRCQSLLLYHVGIFRDAYGHFSAAAEMQRQAAERALAFGDVPGEAICRFVEAVYRLKQALVVGESANQEGILFSILFATLAERFKQLVEATRGSAMEVQWGQGNGPMHMIQACIWLDRPHPDWSKWMATTLAAAEKLGQAWGPGLQLARAAYLDSDSNQEAGAALQAVVDDPGQSNENRATAALVLARRIACDPIAVGALFIRIPREGAQHVHAIAGRLIASATP